MTHTAESDAAAEEYAASSICYRTTNPHSHHNTVKAAFLAGVEYASTRVTPPEVGDA